MLFFLNLPQQQTLQITGLLKNRESSGVAVKSRPGSCAGVAWLTESHQARRALLLIICQDCAPTEIYRSSVACGASLLLPCIPFLPGFHTDDALGKQRLDRAGE